jgi:aerobic-type carbon monoxide dehydrogenase small subunit (CoxS/CutS family)
MSDSNKYIEIYNHQTDDENPLSIAQVRLNRRTFIKRVIASGATVSASGFILSACSGDSDEPTTTTQAVPVSAPASIERLITLNINGKERRVDVLPNETLAMTLRYKLGLTGTKLACDRGECGACTVLLDDISINSCSMLTHSVKNGQVTTIEGLRGDDGALHPVQQAFIDELGPQCGFCTPGQIMSAVGLLKTNPSPSREEAREAMAGNLCRCGAYDNYLNSIMRAAGNDAAVSSVAEVG